MDPSDTQNLASALHTQPSSRNSRPARESVQPWTTTRCHRLLRPLKTHIAALRREIDLEDSQNLSDDGAQDSTSVPAGSKIQHTYSRRGRKPQSAAQSQSRSRGLKQSSSAKRIGREKTTQPGEIVLPTPIIRRARGQQLSSPLQQPPLADSEVVANGKRRFATFNGQRTSSVIAALESEMQTLRTRITATKFSSYDAILRALHSLLTATSEPASSSTGSKSLMAMCLRRVPEYIGELEYWEQREAEEQGTKSALQNSEVSNQIYDEIQEALPTAHGSSHLRTVVRAHGIKVVRDSIAEGLFDETFSILLAKLCCRTKSYHEGEELLQEIVDRSYPRPKGVASTFDESRKLAPLNALRDFAKQSNRPQFLMRVLSKLVSQQLLPLHWLSTEEFGYIWSSMVKDLSTGSSCDDTISFAVQTIISLSSQARSGSFSLRPQIDDLKTLSQQTLLSAITSIATLPILGQEANDITAYHTDRRAVSAIYKRVGCIIQTCICNMRRIRKSSWITMILKLAAYFTSNAHSSTQGIGVCKEWCRIRASQKGADGRQEYEAATSLISSMAQCCGRGTSRPPHDYLIKLCDQLDQGLPVDGSSRKIRADCAFFLAEKTNDLRDLAFAESFDPAGTQQRTQETPRKGFTTSFSGYHWDEDICEWVTATPAVKQPARRISRSLPETPKSDADRGTWRGCVTDTVDRQSSTEDASDDESEEELAKQAGSKQGQKCARTTSRAVARGDPVDDISDGQRVTRLGKRSLRASGLLSLLDDDEGAELLPVNRRDSSRSGGKENRVGLCSSDGAKKRRTTALKPVRNVLRTMTNTAHDDECSEDELGL